MSELDYSESEEYEELCNNWSEAADNSVEELEAIIAWGEYAKGILAKYKPNQPKTVAPIDADDSLYDVVVNTFYPTNISPETRLELAWDKNFRDTIHKWHAAEGPARYELYLYLKDYVATKVWNALDYQSMYSDYEQVNCCLDSESKDVEESTYTSVISW